MARKKKEIVTQEVEEVKEVEEIEELEKNVDEDEYVEITLEERLANIEKKLNFTFIISLFILALSLITMIVVMNGGAGKTTTDNKEETQEVTNNTYDTSAFKEITAKDIESESKGQTIVVMVGRQGCGYCAVYAPIITEVAQKHNVTVRYVDFTKIANVNTSTLVDKDAYDTFVALEAVKEFEGAGKTAMEGTPATLFIRNNKIVYFIRGAATAEILENAFKQSGIK